jgi:hypothetical protein
MPNKLNLFPARVPIGRFVGPDGQAIDVLMTIEFGRALADLLVRVGGANGMTNDELASLVESIGPDAEVLALRGEVAQLRALVEQLVPAVTLQQQIQDIRTEMAMIEDPAALVRYVMTRFATLDSPTFTGIPKAPTAAVDTNTDQLATTKFVLAQAATANPVVDGVAAPGTSTRFARADHVHPTDTTRQAAIVKGTVTGSRGGNVALASLLGVLAGQNIITDSTTA